MMQVERGS